jgi:hypothetical protein
MASTPTACLTASDANLERRQFKNNGQIMSVTVNYNQVSCCIYIQQCDLVGQYADTIAYKHNRKSVLSVIISDISTAMPTM